MALGRAYSVAVQGVDGHIVEIEADVGRGLPGVHLVGLPDAALQESRDRVRAAVINSGEKWPDGRVILALSPATLPKGGSIYDLALACAVLKAAGAIKGDQLEKTIVLGELALDGRLRPVRGILPAVLAARDAGWSTIVVPDAALAEAGLVDGVDVCGAERFADLLSWLRGKGSLTVAPARVLTSVPPKLDLREVIGQERARWAIEVAAAGAHNVLLTGPPGTGKTMLAQRIAGLLPPLTEQEALEVTAISSLAGTLGDADRLVTTPPFVAPHHSSTPTALIGGGTGLARPGAVSRAHRGVLFLDECAELGPKALEALRTPLEDGEVRIARRDGVARFPARFLLVLAANTCPCAPARDSDCVCPTTVRRRYLGKLSGPLIDRIDLRVRMDPLPSVLDDSSAESTHDVRARVIEARKIAAERWRAFGWSTNGEAPGHLVRQRFRPPRTAMQVVESALRRGDITARGADRCLKVAMTLADLGGVCVPTTEHVNRALTLREPVVR